MQLILILDMESKETSTEGIFKSRTVLKNSYYFETPFATPTVFALQNGALDLPRGMSSSSPEFLQVISTFAIDPS